MDEKTRRWVLGAALLAVNVLFLVLAVYFRNLYSDLIDDQAGGQNLIWVVVDGFPSVIVLGVVALLDLVLVIMWFGAWEPDNTRRRGTISRSDEGDSSLSAPARPQRRRSPLRTERRR